MRILLVISSTVWYKFYSLLAVVPNPSTDTQEQRNLHSLSVAAESLLKLADQPGVEDVVVNPDGTLWTNRTGVGFEFVRKFPPASTDAILRQIASFQGLEFNSRRPILETDFPGNGARVTGLRPPLVSAVTMAIRPHPKTQFTLDDYVKAGIITHREDPRNTRTSRQQFVELVRGRSHAEILSLAVVHRQNIIVGGSTGSGKTTALNMAFSEIGRLCQNDRVVGIEDTRELQWYGIKNCVPLLSSVEMPTEQCLHVSLRLKPHRVVVGEVRTAGVANTLISAWNTGHRGGIATVHSDDAVSTLQRFEELLGDGYSRSAIARAINLIVHIDVDDDIPAGRKIREVLLVHGFNAKTHEYDCEFV